VPEFEEEDDRGTEWELVGSQCAREFPLSQPF
jgi:hypothetical protein